MEDQRAVRLFQRLAPYEILKRKQIIELETVLDSVISHIIIFLNAYCSRFEKREER